MQIKRLALIVLLAANPTKQGLAAEVEFLPDFNGKKEHWGVSGGDQDQWKAVTNLRLLVETGINEPLTLSEFEKRAVWFKFAADGIERTVVMQQCKLNKDGKNWPEYAPRDYVCLVEFDGGNFALQPFIDAHGSIVGFWSRFIGSGPNTEGFDGLRLHYYGQPFDEYLMFEEGEHAAEFFFIKNKVIDTDN